MSMVAKRLSISVTAEHLLNAALWQKPQNPLRPVDLSLHGYGLIYMRRVSKNVPPSTSYNLDI